MKKKKLFYITIIFATLLLVSIPILTSASAKNIMSKWGKTLFGYSNNTSEASTFLEGEIGLITNQDIEQATSFFLLTETDKDIAREKAISYAKEREALYQAAIANGFTVTDQEVYDYIEELKKVINSADNKDDAYAIIDQFPSEEAYWEYEFSVYKKNLPIQKYVKSLEDTFAKEQDLNTASERFLTTWDDEFSAIKEDLVLEENFK